MSPSSKLGGIEITKTRQSYEVWLQKLMKQIAIILMFMLLIGCGDDYGRHLSQFSNVDTGMKRINVKLSNSSWPAYCGNSESQAGTEFNNSTEIFARQEIVNDLRGRTQISKGVYLYSKIGSDVFVVASIPHDRFPISEIYLMINGKFKKEDKVLYFKTGIGIQEYDELVKLIGEGAIQRKCFD